MTCQCEWLQNWQGYIVYGELLRPTEYEYGNGQDQDVENYALGIFTSTPIPFFKDDTIATFRLFAEGRIIGNISLVGPDGQKENSGVMVLADFMSIMRIGDGAGNGFVCENRWLILNELRHYYSTQIDVRLLPVREWRCSWLVNPRPAVEGGGRKTPPCENCK